MGVKLTVNQLNDAWIASGQKVSDLNDQINMALNNDKFSAEAMAELKNQRDNEKVRRDALHEQLVEAQAEQAVNLPKNEVTPLNPEQNKLKDKFISDFVNMMQDPIAFKVKNSVDSSADDSNANAGLTIPEDVRTAINKLTRQFDSLEQYVKKETVATKSGSRVYEKWSDVTALVEMDKEDGKIPDLDNPQLYIVKYLIKRYAGIITATNTLLKDTAENIMAWLTGWVAKKVVVTRNGKILEAMGKAKNKVTLAKFDDIISMVNTAVDPAIVRTSYLLTNQSGLNQLALIKDSEGRYLLETDPTKGNAYLIKGKKVVVVSDVALPNIGQDYPLYYGDFKQGITLFDLEHLSLTPTNIGAGAFETDTTKIRVIDRFDVEVMDNEAWVVGSFASIANQDGSDNKAAGSKTTKKTTEE